MSDTTLALIALNVWVVFWILLNAAFLRGRLLEKIFDERSVWSSPWAREKSPEEKARDIAGLKKISSYALPIGVAIYLAAMIMLLSF